VDWRKGGLLDLGGEFVQLQGLEKRKCQLNQEKLLGIRGKIALSEGISGAGREQLKGGETGKGATRQRGSDGTGGTVLCRLNLGERHPRQEGETFLAGRGKGA